MRKNLKVFISILLCFMMLFGEMVPAGVSSAVALAENYDILEVQNPPDIEEADNSTPEKTVTENVYAQEELFQNPDEEMLGLKAASLTVGTSSVFTISGRVLLPEGKVAPAGGLALKVYAKSSSKTTSVSVAIPEGKSSADYTVIVPQEAVYTLYYQTSNADYVGTGYYCEGDTVRSSSAAEQIILTADEPLQSDINLTLIAKRDISGAVTLPDDGVAPAGGVSVTITAASGSDKATVAVIIPEGHNSADYMLKVPPSTSDKGYLVSYQTSNGMYLQTAYYSVSGSVRYNTLATLIDVSAEDKGNINLNLIAKKRITGTISLPEGTAPKDGVKVTVWATYGSDKDSQTVVIPEGASSIEYVLYVPDGSGYTLYYETSDIAYLNKGYYNENGTVKDSKAATPIDTVLGDAVDKNIILIAKRIVSGKVSLPKDVAPEGGISVEVIVALNKTKVESKSITIPEGKSEATYSMYVPTGSGYNVSYKTSNNLYVEQGYYKKGSTVRYLSSATLITVDNEDLNNIDLELIEKRFISGVLSMPSGTAPYGGISFEITAYNGSEEAKVTVTIPEGESSVPYSINVPADEGYIIKSKLLTLQSIYMNEQYYSSGGTVYNVASASKVSTIAGNQPNINIMLLEKRTVSGTLSLPEGYYAPPGGMIFTHETDGRTTFIVIPAGERSGSFTIYYNPGVYKLFYQCPEDDIFVSPGYYSKGGTVVDKNSADDIDVREGNQVGINLVLLLKKTISGKVVLSNGVAPKGGYTVKVKASGSKGSAEQTVMIEEGEKSADYILFVNPGEKYKVWYESSKEYTFVSPMYYNSDGMVRDSSRASLLDLSKENKTDIDLTLTEMRAVSGNIVVPSGVAPSGGISVDVVVSNGKDSTKASVTIPAGAGFVSYTAYVPAGKGYKVKYEVNSKSDYATDGYYGVSGTTLNASSAASLDLTSENKAEVNMTLIPKRSISGTVSLPSGMTLSSDTKVTVYAGDSYNATVTIPKNESSVEYTIKVPPNNAGSGYKVYYKLSSSSTMFITPGYYSSSGMTVSEIGAELVDVSSTDAKADLVLIPKSSINGSVKLPEGVTAKSDLKVTVTASNNKNKGSVTVTIPEGKNSAEYSVYVPSGTGYLVEYSVTAEEYLKKGYYSTSGTVKDSSAATLINLDGESKQNVNLQLLRNNKITGSVTLPKGVAPSGGLKVTICASNSADTVKTTVTIPQGYNTINYTLYVPEGKNYTVWYEATDRRVMPTGYYSDGGTTVDKSKAKPIDATINVSSININLIPKMEVSGNVKLLSAPAPAGGISVKLTIDNKVSNDTVDVVIPEGFMSASYVLYVPAGEKYVLKYTTSSAGFVSPGFYSESGSKETEKEASLLNILGDRAGIDISLITKRTIRGTILLPEGYAPAGGVNVKVTAQSSSDKITASFIIPEGESSVPYTLYVSSGKEYIVKYETTDEKYISTGYYSISKTTRQESEADKLDTTEGDQVGINLKLISNRYISGSVSIPTGIAPFAGIKVRLKATNGNDTKTLDVVIPEVSSSTTYKLYVPEGKDYELSYSIINPDGKYFPAGYYNGVTATREKEECVLLDLSKESKEGINMTLIPNRLVTGSLVLPSGVAPSGGLRITVTASNSRDSVATTVNMPQGSSSIVYRMYLPEGNDYTIGYTISHEDYLNGYYNINETVLTKDEATTFNVEKNDILGLNIVLIAKRTISGIVSLPNGKTAPAGGIDVTISAGSYSTKVTIPQNKSNVTYTLKLSPNAIGSGYTVKYTITSATDFVQTGFYGKDKTVPRAQTANLVDVSFENKVGINLNILEKRIIGGVFRLGSGVAPSGGMNVTISAIGKTAEGKSMTYQQVINIPFGQNQADFGLKVDPSYYGSGYKLMYTMASEHGYAENGYYNEERTVQNEKEATLIYVDEEDQLGKEITAIGKNHISGNVSLPDGVKAPKGGIKLSIHAENSKDSGSVNVTIPEGESSANYMLIVPPGTQYKLYYSMAPNDKYVTNGYLSSEGTVVDSKNAELFDVKENIDKKNIVLISKRKVSGEVRLPIGVFAPKGGLKVEVTVQNTQNSDSVTVTIPQNGQSQSFELYLPPQNGYKMYYTLSSGTDYVSKGYYAGSGTVPDEKLALEIDLRDKDLNDAKLSLIENSIIKGSVVLPYGQAPEGGIEVRITADNGKFKNIADVTIPENGNRIDYVLPVPPASGYTVSYQVSTGLDFRPKGYYSNKGTTTSVSEASKLDLTAGGKEGINLSLIYYNSISGTISLPEGIAPKEGVTFSVFAANSKNKREIAVTIPSGKSSANYTIYIPDGYGYKIYYVMAPDSKYVDKGFYAGTETVIDEKDAANVDVNGDSVTDISFAIIAKRTISGTISLKDGEKAPQEGLAVRVTALDGDEQTVVIPYGKSSATYSLNVVPNAAGKGYKVRFETMKNYGYVRYGYYAQDGSVRSEAKAELVDVSRGNKDNVNYELTRPRTIKGTLRLPESATASRDITVNIVASNSIDSADTVVYIPKGSKEAAYTLAVPPNDDTDDYKVRYENWYDNSFASTGYYGSSETVRNADLAKGVNVRKENASGINITLIAKKTVSGKVSLPFGTAPKGGLTVTVYAENNTDKIISYVTIPEGQSSMDYSLSVPVGKGYRIGYEMSIKNDFVPWGYYGIYGTAYMPANAHLMNVSNDISGIDLSLIAKKSISGTVSLPEGTAPKGGIKVEIYAEDAGDTWVTIPEGKSSAEYTMKVLPNLQGSGYKIKYVVSSDYDLVGYGYYNKNGTVRNSKLAQSVDANNKDVENIDIELMKPRRISGKVSLPEGVAPLGGVSLNIAIFNETDGNSQIITIPEGKSSASYSISLPPNDPGYEYIVRYENWSNKVYTTYGYYNSKETTNNMSHAGPVNVNEKDASNIDMVLLRKAMVSGIIEVPENAIIPEEGLNVRIYVSNDVETYSTNVRIPYGAVSVPYSVHVEAGSGYRLFYVLDSNESFMEYGYYDEKGVYTDKKKAKVFSVYDENISGHKLKLLEKRTISGKLILPTGVFGDESYFEVTISATNGYDIGEAKILVPYGKTQVNYTLSIPAGSGYTLLYEIPQRKGYASLGYYSVEGTVRNKGEAEALDLRENDMTDIDISLIQDMTISGTIRLPQGTAPEGGIQVVVTATDESGNESSETVTILEGESLVDYYLNVPPNAHNSGYKVRYSVSSNEYATLGYYSESGTKVLADEATLVDVSSGNAEDINLMLIEKKIVSGIVSIPEGVVGVGGLSVTINATSKLFSVDDTVTVIIPEGSSMVPYILRVSPNVEGADYILSYQVSGDAYINNGYYNEAATVVDINMATPVDVSSGDYTNANISLIRSRKISGKISLPEGATAPKGGLPVTVFAEKTDYTGYRITKSVTIPEKQSSVDYILYVPESTSRVVGLKLQASTGNGTEDKADDYVLNTEVFVPVIGGSPNSVYKVGYSYTVDDQYYRSGFYSNKGTVPAIGMAGTVDVAKKDIQNVDFALLKKNRTIKGTIKLPEGKTASGNVEVEITAENDVLDFTPQKTVIISKGKSAVEYEITVPSIDNYRIKYTIKSTSEGCVTSGYYAKTGTVGKPELSTLISTISGNVEGINLNLIPGIEIRGRVSLPTGQKVNRNDFWMWVSASNENYESSAYVTISKGGSSANYSLYVPEGSEYVVSYSILPLFGEYVEKGYHNKSVTTANKDSATKYNVTKNISGINLTLLPLDRAISGVISLPDGTASVGYTINVPANNRDNGYQVEYSVVSGNNDGSYNERGYFSQSGTSSDKARTSIIDVSSRNSTGNDMTLLTNAMVPINAIMLDKYQVTVQSGKTVNLKVKYLPENATNKAIKWTTSNTNVAEVSSEGVVKAKATGTAVITARTYNSVMTSFTVKVIPADGEGLSIDKLSISINPGEKEQLEAIFTPRSEDEKVIWKSDNTEVAVVSEKGLVTAKKSGTAVITAVSSKDPSIYATSSVIVITPVTSVEIDKSKLEIKAGYTDKLTAKVLPETASYKGITWTSSDESIVRISQSGEVTAVNIGTAVVTASSIYNPSIKAVCNVKVIPVPVERISLDKETVTLYPDEYILINAEVLPSNASDKRVAWKSDNTSVATVTAEGLVKAVNIGETKIVATSLYDSSKKAVCVIKVVERPVTKVTFKNVPESILVGQSKSLEVTVSPANATNKTLIWSSSDKNIATVTEDGLVTGKGVGTVTITASWKNDPSVKAVCTLKVEPVKVLGIKLKQTNVSLGIGDEIKLVADVIPENATNKDIVWSTSDRNIATVTSDGTVRAISLGKATITATSKESSSIKATCTITVTGLAVSQVKLNSKPSTLTVGSTHKLTVTINPANAADKTLEWSSSDTSVATVSSSGVVTAKRVGTVTITVNSKSKPSCKDSCTIKIVEAATPSPTPTAVVDEPIVIPGGAGGGGGAPIVSIDGTPTPSATPIVTATPTAGNTPPVNPSTKPTQAPTDSNSLDFFTDIKGHWAADFFADLLKKEIVSGYPDRTLRPNAQITRAEATVMVMKAAGFEVSDSIELTCSDKDSVPAWAKAYIATAMHKGVIKGYEDGSFRPSNRLTRQETVVLVLRAFGIEEAQDKTLTFADSEKIPAWSRGYVKKAVELGIIKGYNDNTFGPQKEITRAEVATIISKCMQLKGK
ncbi:Ig-like domain-containing protein [Acetivibrio mesophilus]|uniref:SLH domain-containing protein n=1 Tax=Acetivibrio mesophilus TaxID=2487273 RepID=A0A4Q0I5F8_9FIRM|nr:Ig-like domain-containing protein [Acetivibrio mesophilus]RXE59077.1 hypothetical protein EFD62_08925 [Acetivibrio mesophilus]